MAIDAEIRPLRKDDDLQSFSCGQPELDRFFQHYAGQNQFKLHLAVTYVAVVSEHIVGFATVAMGSVERRSVLSSRLRKRLPAYPVTVLRLARLGVDQRAQGSGVGRALLRHVLALAVAERDKLGCAGVVADSKPDAEPFYRAHGFVPIASVEEGSLHGDPLPMFLAIDSIAAALGHRAEELGP